MRGVWQKLHWWTQSWLDLEGGGWSYLLCSMCPTRLCGGVLPPSVHTENSPGIREALQPWHFQRSSADPSPPPVCKYLCQEMCVDFLELSAYLSKLKSGYHICTCEIHLIPSRIISTLEKIEKWKLKPVKLCETERRCAQHSSSSCGNWRLRYALASNVFTCFNDLFCLRMHQEVTEVYRLQLLWFACRLFFFVHFILVNDLLMSFKPRLPSWCPSPFLLLNLSAHLTCFTFLLRPYVLIPNPNPFLGSPSTHRWAHQSQRRPVCPSRAGVFRGVQRHEFGACHGHQPLLPYLPLPPY